MVGGDGFYMTLTIDEFKIDFQNRLCDILILILFLKELYQL